MAEKDWTFEEIDKHVQQADLNAFAQGGAHHFTAAAAQATPGDVLKKICAIYKVVRPILVAVSKIPLIPKKWRDAITTFVGLMDQLCP
jgi:hypothetical protein